MRLIGVKGPSPDVHLTAVPIKREWTVFHVSPSAVKKNSGLVIRQYRDYYYSLVAVSGLSKLNKCIAESGYLKEHCHEL